MSKKQLILLAFVAAIPACGLLVKMLFSLGYYLLKDASDAGAMVWIIYVICLLGSVFFTVLPLLLWLYYPAAGFEGATAPSGGLQHPAAGLSSNARAVSDDDEFEDSDDEEAVEDDGEAYFEEDALQDESDEFDGGFDDDDQ